MIYFCFFYIMEVIIFLEDLNNMVRDLYLDLIDLEDVVFNF